MSTLREAGPPRIRSWPPRACEGKDTAMFFPVHAGTSVEAMAKAWCRICEAKEACLAYSLPIEDLAGVWAGMNQNERARARKKQREA